MRKDNRTKAFLLMGETCLTLCLLAKTAVDGKIRGIVTDFYVRRIKRLLSMDPIPWNVVDPLVEELKNPEGLYNRFSDKVDAEIELMDWLLDTISKHFESLK